MIVYGGFAFNPSITVIFILFSIYGIYAAATEGVIKAWITNLAHKENTATAIGFYTSCFDNCFSGDGAISPYIVKLAIVFTFDSHEITNTHKVICC